MLRHQSLRLPEGRWTVASERRPTTNFVADLRTELCSAVLHGDDLLQLVLFNTQQLVHICRPEALSIWDRKLKAFRSRAT